MNAGTMSLRTQEVVGRPVISLQGEEVGTIARVVVDPAQGKVVAVTVNVKGLFKGEKGIEFETVHAFGDYAVTIADAGRVVPLNTLPKVETLARECNMYNMRILTPEGKLVGTVDDFTFNAETGEIDKYILSGGLIKNLYKGKASLPASSIEKIGKDVIISSINVEEAFQKESGGLQDNLENIKGDLGNWKGDLDQWKDDFEKLWDRTRSKTLDLSKTVSTNLVDAAKTGTGVGKQLISKTGEVLSEKTDELKKSYEVWVDRLHMVKNGGTQPLTPEDFQALIGLKASRTITDDDWNIIIEENQAVTQEVIEAAQKTAKVKELLISVAARDLEDQMKSIEEETEK